MGTTRIRKFNKNITEGSLRSSFWKLAMPIIAGALMQDLFTLVDLFFVGRLGYIAVAALSVSGVILAVIIMVAIGISSGTTALIAHFVGKKDYTSADNVLFQTFAISIACSLVMALVGIFGTNLLLRIFGASHQVIPQATVYLKISFICSIFIFLFITFNQALRGSGDAVTPLKILALSNAINIILDPMLIFGFWFFPRMGVAGSAVATVISETIGVSLLLKHLIAGDSTLHFRKETFKLNFILMGRMIKIGFFASFEVLMRQLSLLMLLRLVNYFGASCLAAFGIGLRLRMSIIMIGLGMGIASSVLIGQNMGADQPQRATQSGWKGLKYFETIIIPISVLLFIFSHKTIALFNSHPEVVSIGSHFLRFSAITLPFLASTLILSRGVSGAGDTMAPAIMTGIAQIGLRMPIAYILVYIFKMGSNGIWLGINTSDICQGLAMLWYFKSKYWQKRYYKHRRILEGTDTILT